MAAEWRKEFKKDVIIDLVCYRRYGHNGWCSLSWTVPLYRPVKNEICLGLKNTSKQLIFLVEKIGIGKEPNKG